MKSQHNARTLAELIGVSHQTIYNWVDFGLPHHYIADKKRISLRFDEAECREWLRKWTKDDGA